MLIKTLGKTYVKEILTLLNEHGELHFSEINKYIPTHKSSLNRTLSFLIKEGLIKKRQESLKTPLPKSYYSLTEKGKKAILLYELENKIEHLKNNQNIVINIVNSKNHTVINNANVVNIK